MKDPELWWGLVKVVVVLLVLTPVIYFVTKWYGKFQGTSTTLKIRERIAFGGNKSLYIIEWEKTQYLLAVTSQNIEFIDRKASVSETTSNLSCGKVESDNSHSFD